MDRIKKGKEEGEGRKEERSLRAQTWMNGYLVSFPMLSPFIRLFICLFICPFIRQTHLLHLHYLHHLHHLRTYIQT